MKRLFLLLLLCTFAFAEFKLQATDISVKIAEDGSAVVEEKLDLIAYGQYSMQLYESGYNKNTLASWQELTGISEIKTHLSARGVDIRNIVIRPQPLQKSKSGLEVWYGQIIIDYIALPVYDKSGNVVNNTGIVLMDKYKPRTTRYTLNINAFDFDRTNTGDIKLGEETYLSITPPANAMLTYLNPITQDMHDTRFPAQSRTLKWNGLTLVQFSLTYEVEQSLDKEVVEFFSRLQESMRTSLVSTEGLAGLAIAAIIVLSYFYLRLSRR